MSHQVIRTTSHVIGQNRVSSYRCLSSVCLNFAGQPWPCRQRS
jgi:hypothetical protein